MGQMLTGLSIASAPMRVEWTPSLHRVAASVGESRSVATRPSPLVVVPSQPVASTAVVAAAVLEAILVTTEEVGSEVTLAAPPPPAVVEEERDTGLPALPGGGPYGSPSRSELEVLGGCGQARGGTSTGGP